MNHKRVIRFSAAASYIVLLTLSSFITQPPQIATHINRVDLLEHFFAYGIMAWLLVWALRTLDIPFSKRRLIGIVITVCLMIGILNEFIQYFTPGRQVGIDDVLANLLGAVLFFIIFRKRIGHENKQEA